MVNPTVSSVSLHPVFPGADTRVRPAVVVAVACVHAALLVAMQTAPHVPPEPIQPPVLMTLEPPPAPPSRPTPPAPAPAPTPKPAVRPNPATPARAQPAPQQPPAPVLTTTAPTATAPAVAEAATRHDSAPAAATPAPAAAPAAAAPPPARRAEPEQPVTPPRHDAAYLDNPAPPYPPAARRLGEEGRVVLAVRVTVDGRAAEVTVRQGSGSARLDRAALDAVTRWRFVPARRGSEPVEATVLVPVVFSLSAGTAVN